MEKDTNLNDTQSFSKGDTVEIIGRSEYGKCKIVWVVEDVAMLSNGRAYSDTFPISQLKKVTNPS